MSKKYVPLLFAIVLMLTLITVGAATADLPGLSVTLDPVILHSGEPPYSTLEVSGTVLLDGAPVNGMPVSALVGGPGGQLLTTGSTSTNTEGRFTFYLVLPVDPPATATVEVFVGGAAPVQQVVDIPLLPSAYYGNVEDNLGNPVSSGIVKAYIDSQLVGQLSFNGGYYGGSGIFDTKLVATGTLADKNKTVSFKVEVAGQEINATPSPAVNWLPADVRRVDLAMVSQPVFPPTVATNAASGITQTAATLNGVISDNGGAAIDSYGFDWGTSSGSLTNHVVVGTSNPGSLPFSFNTGLSTLTPDTTYYFKAYAHNSAGNSANTDEMSFTTPPASVPPTVATAAADFITQTTANLNGVISANGGADIDSYGFDWGTSSGSLTNHVVVGTSNPGSLPFSFNTGLSTLTPDTTYYFKAYAHNSAGNSANTDVQSFTTLGDSQVLQVVSTNPIGGATDVPVDIPQITITFNMNVYKDLANNFNNISLKELVTEIEVPINRVLPDQGSPVLTLVPQAPLNCQTEYIVDIPYAALQWQSLMGMVPNDQYAFTFTTATNAAPEVYTNNATDITSASATLNGNIVDNVCADATEYGFYWGVTSNPTNKVVVGTGLYSGAFSRSLTQLNPCATYYFRAYAVNGNGTSFGDVLSFTTLPIIPGVQTNAATGVAITTATINGSIIANNCGIDSYGFDWGTSPGSLTNHVEVGTSNPGSLPFNFNTGLSGLTPDTTYYFKAYAHNSAGNSANMDVMSFTTLPAPVPPTVATNAASGITQTAANLSGVISANGGAAIDSYGFDWGTNPGSLTNHVEVGTSNPGSLPFNFNTGLSGLTANTTYYFKAYAHNSAGTSANLDVMSFTTLEIGVNPPTVITNNGTDIMPVSATLNGSISANGGLDIDSYGFDWGTSSGSLNNHVVIGTSNPGSLPFAFSKNLTGLTPDTTYFFRAYAHNPAGTGYGEVKSFTTYSTPPPLDEITLIVDPASMSLVIGQTSQIHIITLDPADATITYSHDNGGVATVDDNGLVTGVGNGSTNVTVTASKAGYMTKSVVIPVEVTGPNPGEEIVLVVDPASMSLDIGQTSQINIVTLSPADSTVTYTYSDGGVATVDDNGLVTGVGEGNASVTVTASKAGYISKSVEVPVEVTGPDPGEEIVLVVDPASMSLDIGQTGQINIVTLSPADSSVTYTSSNTSVATVDSTGLVTGVGEGDATVTVIASKEGYISKSVEVPVTVTGPDPGEQIVLIVDPNSMSLAISQTGQINIVTLSPSDSTITYASSNTSVATVDSTGLVTGVGAGSATVTVTASKEGYISKLVDIPVTVNEPGPGDEINLVVNPASMSLDIGQTGQIEIVTLSPADSTVAYTCIDTDIATVDGNGLVTGVEEGDTTVIVTASKEGYTSRSVEVPITVNEPGEQIVLEVDPASMDLAIGQYGQIEITTLSPADSTVSYTCSNTGIAAVDENGVVTGEGEGSATVTVTASKEGYTSKSVDVAINVHEPDPLEDNVTLEIDPTSITMTKGNTKQIDILSVNPADSTITYTYSNGSIATVNSAGLVTAVGTGSATVTVTASKAGFAPASIEVPVTVKSGGGGGGGGGGSPTVAEPKVITFVPEKDKIDVALNNEVSATFDIDVQEKDLSGVVIKDSKGTKLSGVTPALSGRKLTIGHPDFAYSTLYTVTISANAVKNADGDAYNKEVSWSFTTAKEADRESGNECEFTDVPGTYWASDVLNQLCEEGVIGGYPDGSFKPNNTVTRAEFVKMLVKSMGMAEVKPEKPTYSDLVTDAWYYGVVEAAAKAGTVRGYDTGEFKPGALISREEIAAILARVIGKEELGKTYAGEKTSFTDDTQIASWARGVVVVSTREGIIKGYPDGSFGPKKNATRAEAAVMIYRAMNQ